MRLKLRLVTSPKGATGREDFPTYNKKRKDVGWETFPTENVVEKLLHFVFVFIVAGFVMIR